MSHRVLKNSVIAIFEKSRYGCLVVDGVPLQIFDVSGPWYTIAYDKQLYRELWEGEYIEHTYDIRCYHK